MNAVSLVISLSLVSSSALAADATLLVQEGDAVANGNVTTVSGVMVNSNGDWRVEVDTDNVDTNLDGALVGPGGFFLQEGQPLVSPPGASLDSFDSFPLNDLGQSSYNFFLAGTAGSTDDSGIYDDNGLILQEGDAAGYPGASAGTIYIGFFDTKINDAGQILVLASVDDPAVTSTVDRALVRLEPAGLGAFTQSLVSGEGFTLPGDTAPVLDFDTSPQNLDFNNAGQTLFLADRDTGDTATDIALFLDDTLLAVEGGLSPDGVRLYDDLDGEAVSLDDFGGVLFTAGIDGDTATDKIVVLNGQVVAQEGSSLPGIPSPYVLTGFGSGSVELANNGNWVIFGDWDDPDTTIDTGLFVNGRLLIQEGVAYPGVGIVDDLRGVTEGMALSSNGQFLIIRSVLDGGVEAAILFDLSDQVRIPTVIPGVAGVQNTIRIANGVPGHRVLVAGGTASGSTMVPCGGGMIEVQIANPRILGAPIAGADGSAFLSARVPAAAAGRTLYVQPVDYTSCAVGELRPVTF